MSKFHVSVSINRRHLFTTDSDYTPTIDDLVRLHDTLTDISYGFDVLAFATINGTKYRLIGDIKYHYQQIVNNQGLTPEKYERIYRL